MNATCHTLSFGSCGGMVVVSSMVWETVSGRGAYARADSLVRLKSDTAVTVTGKCGKRSRRSCVTDLAGFRHLTVLGNQGFRSP